MNKAVFNTILFLLLFTRVGAQADAIFNKAEEFRKAQKWDSAVLYFNDAAVRFQQQGEMEKFVNSYNQVGVVLTRQDKYEPAKTYLEKALAIGLSQLGADHLAVGTTYLALGVIYGAQDRFDESLRYHQQALDIRLRKLGEFHSDVATSYGNIGNVNLRKGDVGKAIEAHLLALKIRERLFGPTGMEVTQSLTNLGNAYKEKKEYSTALYYYEKALKNKIIQRGEGHRELERFYMNVSDLHYLLHDKVNGDLFKNKAAEVIKNN